MSFGGAVVGGHSVASDWASIANTASWANYADLTVELDATQIRNDVLASGGTVLQAVRDTFTGDGLTFTWTLSGVPDFTAAQRPVVTVNGVPRTVQQGGSGAAASDYVVDSLSSGVASLRAGLAGVPASGAAIVVTYQQQVEAMTRQQQGTSIAAAASLPNRGIFTMMPRQLGALGLAGAVQGASTQLTLYAQVITSVQLVVPEQYTGPPFTENQQIQISSGRLGWTLTGVLSDRVNQGSPGGNRQQRRLTLMG